MDEREQRHRVSITLEVEELFAAMFGERAAHCVAGNGPAREWQKWCKKLSKELRKYVDANLYTDREHRECIRAVLDEINSSAHKPQAEREPLMVAGLSRLVLLLLGDLPNHHSHQKGERWNFRLSRFRRLTYSRSAAQESHLLYRSLVEPYVQERSERGEEARRWEKLYDRCRNCEGFRGFIARFRKQRGPEYFGLFS